MSKYWTFSFRATVPFVHSYTVKAKDQEQAIEIVKRRMEAHDPVLDWEQKKQEIKMIRFINNQEEGK